MDQVFEINIIIIIIISYHEGQGHLGEDRKVDLIDKKLYICRCKTLWCLCKSDQI